MAAEIELDASEFGEPVMEAIKGVCLAHPGYAEVVLKLGTREGLRSLRFGKRYQVADTVRFREDLAAVLREHHLGDAKP